MNFVLKFTPEFIRSFNRLELSLREEVKEKIALFKKQINHPSLKVHKLHGRLRNCLSFSVNYKYRIIFEYVDKKIIALKSIGSHDVYK